MAVGQPFTGVGTLRVINNDQLDAMERQRAAMAIPAEPEPELPELTAYIRNQFDIMKRHRTTIGLNQQLLDALKIFNGEYSINKLAEIRKFGGSEVYAKIIAAKCRGASSLLRDVYLGTEKSWGISPPEDPDVPPEVIAKIMQLVSMEVQSMQEQFGQEVDASMVRDRIEQLFTSARDAEKKNATKRAKLAEEKMEEILSEGGFYEALAEFIVDLPLFKFACLKGPTVKILPKVEYMNGTVLSSSKPVLCWSRISPFDILWSPGVNNIAQGAVIERVRLTRSDLNDLLDLPGYNRENVEAVLTDYKDGYVENIEDTDTERAEQEGRENPHLNQTGLIDCLEYHGPVQGKMLQAWGMDPILVPDPIRDYMVQAWLIGRYLIKIQISPSPRKRHPYYITSFEKVPGTPLGNALPDILSDIQDVCNATLRALVNNLSISSGPQVVINDDVASPGADNENLFPWKRWHVTNDPMVKASGARQEPVYFFQPNMHAQELFSVYEKFVTIADETSAIPRYLSGANPGSGAGRTASGLAMLMGNASKLLQTVAANVDNDVISPALYGLYDMLILTDNTGMLHGDENIRVLGVNVAIQKETERSRQLEFLQITANPIDTQIMGPRGRANVLRSVSATIGLDGQLIVPTDEELAAQIQQQQMAAAAAAAQGDQAPKGGDVTGDSGPRTNTVAIQGGAQ